jgi:hypothetical protein
MVSPDCAVLHMDDNISLSACGTRPKSARSPAERVADFLCELKLLRQVAQGRLKPSDYPRHTVALVCASDGTRLRICRQVSHREARPLAHDIGLDLARLRRGDTGARGGERHVACFEKKWPRREGVPCGAESRAGPSARCSKGRPRGNLTAFALELPSRRGRPRESGWGKAEACPPQQIPDHVEISAN